MILTGGRQRGRTMNICGRAIKGAVFDIDGTLMDSMPIWDELGARYLKRRGVRPAEDLGTILFPMTIEEGVHYLRTVYLPDEDESTIRDGLMSELAAFYKNEVPLKKGAAEVLERFRKEQIPMILATIGDQDLENAALQRLGIRDFFQDMLFCEDYGTTKRESTIYRVCAEKLNLLPEETVVFEDVLQAVRSAKNAGCLTVGVFDEASRKDAGEIRKVADLYIRSWTELPEILENDASARC